MERVTMRANHSGSGAAASARKARLAGLLVVVILGFSTCTLGDLPLRDTLVELAEAYEWDYSTSFQGEPPATSDYYGYSVAIRGDWAAIGDYSYNFGAGRVYVLKKTGSGWAVETRLDGVAAPNYFGKALAISDEFLFIGAPAEEPGAPLVPTNDIGVVHVYRLVAGAWTFLKRIEGVAALGQFGSAIALGDTFAIIGAPNYDGNRGIAYAVPRGSDTWNMASRQDIWQKAADREAGDRFGGSISLDGDWCLVGASGDDSGMGAAFAFHWSGTAWGALDGRENQKLVADVRAATDQFGASVALMGESAAVGAPVKESVYTFAVSGSLWERDASRIFDASGVLGDKFGSQVSLSEGAGSAGTPVLVVGAPFSDLAATDAGRVWFFERKLGQWIVQKGVSPDARAGARLGSALSCDGAGAVIGAFGLNSQSGAAYMYGRVKN